MLGSVSKSVNYMKRKDFSGKETGYTKALKYVDAYLGNIK